MKIEIVKMYLEDMDGRGTNFLTLVDSEGIEYQPEVEVHNTRENVEFIRVAPTTT